MLQLLARLVELYGFDARELLRDFGADPALLFDPKARLPARLGDAAFQRAAALIPDPAFALRSAECWHPSHLGILGYGWLSSGTLRIGLRLIERYSRVVGTKATVRCSNESGGVRFRFDHGRGDTLIGLLLADGILALVLGMCRMNFGGALHPIEVHLRRPQPTDPTPYEVFFGCPIRFGAAEDSFLLGAEVIDVPLDSGNPDLALGFDSILAEQMAALGDYNLASRCRAYLLPRLASGSHSEEELAMYRLALPGHGFATQAAFRMA